MCAFPVQAYQSPPKNRRRGRRFSSVALMQVIRKEEDRMTYREASTVVDAFREVFHLVREDCRRYETGRREDEVMYYSRY